MVDDLKGRLDAVLARKDVLDKAAAAKTKQTQRAQDNKYEAEAKRQKEIYRAWSVQNDHLKIAVMEMNWTLAEQDLEFKLVRERDLKRVGAKIDLCLFENGEQKLCASITLSDDAVKIATKRRIFGTRTLSTFNVGETSFNYCEIMVGLLEQLYP
jgi:hypothetical protein